MDQWWPCLLMHICVTWPQCYILNADDVMPKKFFPHYWFSVLWVITHWGRVMHICISKLTIIGSDNGLSPERHQAIIWTNAGIVLIRRLRTNFREISSEIRIFSFKKMQLKMSSGKWRPFCLGLNVLMNCISCCYFQVSVMVISL